MAFAGTTGKMIGTALDDKGAKLPGVTVTITSPALIGGAQTAVTEQDGTFSFPSLPPGIYTVKFDLASFLTQERTEVQIRLDRTTEITAMMPLAKYGEAVTVTAETPVIDPTQTSTSQTFTSDLLTGAAVGSGRRGYQSVLNMAPGVVGTGNPNVFGSTLGENAYYIDGLDTTDPVTATFGTNFNFDAIQEISLQTGGFEAEYGRATGGIVNLVTKSGGNKFSGTLDVRYRKTNFYQNGDHFNRDTNPVKFLDPSVTLGGPILRDALWFFVSGEDVDSQVTPSGAPVTRKFKGQNYIGKATWAASSNWRLAGKYSADPAEIDNVNAVYYRTADATAHQSQPGKAYQIEATGTLSPLLLWNTEIGFNRSKLNAYPQSGSEMPPGHYDDYTGIYSVNYTNAQYSQRNRDEYKTNLTYFLGDLAGSHEFKGGVEYNKLFFSSQNYTTGGGVYYEDRNSVPRWIWAAQNAGPVDYNGTLYTGYAQDAWRPMPNLTIKYGVRYDTVSYKNDVGTKVADMNKLQPRLGVAWDVNKDAKTLVKGSWGRFMHPNALTLPSNARQTFTPTYLWRSCSYYAPIYGFDVSQCDAYAAAHGYSYSTSIDPIGWDPTGWFQRPNAAGEVTSSSPGMIAPGLKPTYADEFVLGVEREIFNKTSLELSYVKKDTKDIFEDTCNGNFPVVGGSSDCAYYVMMNLPGLKRDYEGVILKLETRAKDWLHLLVSYTYAKSRGNVEYTQNAGTDFDFYPDLFTNTYGYLSDDRRHRVKVNGYVILPYDFTVGIDAYWSSPFAYSDTCDAGACAPVATYGTVFLAPRGSLRANSNSELDLEIRKGFRIGDVRLQLIGTVINVFNAEQVTGVCETNNDWGSCGSTLFGQATTWQTPRRFEAGFRIEF
jgi:hypothetical protein